MAKYKIIFDKEACIGVLACSAAAAKFWIPKDKKVELKDAVYNEKTRMYELIIDEKDFAVNQEAAEVCPVEAIKVEKIEDKKGKK
ncbi:MAG: ferredoxin [Nanoarchaeota archaeon]